MSLEDNDPAQEAAAQAGFSTAIGASTTVSYVSLDALTVATVTDYSSLYAALSSPATAASERTALADAISGLNYGVQVSELAANDLAITQATNAVIETEAAVTALGSAGTDYLAASQARVLATETLEDAQEADAQIAEIQSVVDQYTSLDR